MNRILSLIVLVVASSQSFAGEYIGVFHPYWYNSSLYIKPIGAIKTNQPACVKRNLLRLQESDTSSVVFKYKYSMLWAAWAADRKIKLIGTGECTAEGDEIIYVVNQP